MVDAQTIKHALESAGVHNVEAVLLHEFTGLGLVIRKSGASGWYSETFKVNGQSQIVHAGKLIEIPSKVPA